MHWIKHFFLTYTFFVSCGLLYSQVAIDKYLSNQTVTYEEAIAYYSAVASKDNRAELLEYGLTDVGKPLHLFVISKDGDFDPVSLRNKNKRIILVNNAIHPGESCGVDASIKLTHDLLNDKAFTRYLDNVVIGIIPVYNIGGALNRGCCSRANQNGPEKYGFRGNAKNLDLNRDFIKCDSKNAKSFTQIFQLWRPDIFIDTHTSNGADYQYVMTLIATQKDKLNPVLGNYMNEIMVPSLYAKMKKHKYEMVPYVNSIDKIPDNGIYDYLETPRYSTGYAALFNTIGFITETHMLKPFKDRVLSTCYFLSAVIEYTNQHHAEIGEVRKKADKAVIEQQDFIMLWRLDSSNYKMIPFKGYEAKYKPSEITGEDRLYYDRASPFTKQIKYYNTYKPQLIIDKPFAYIIPQGWKDVIERLQHNRVEMKRLAADTTLRAGVYFISDYRTIKQPYEGHYLHYDVVVQREAQHIKYYKGDYVVLVNQLANRYIVETLEPQSKDSYFAWNFFDSALQQKEWFSSYVFEDKAAELLKSDVELKKRFEDKKATDAEFAGNSRAQLLYIYQNSPNYEKSHNRYPVHRIENDVKLNLSY